MHHFNTSTILKASKPTYKRIYSKKKGTMLPKLTPIAQPLLAWYYQNRRILPFRENPTPYNIWVSEIMLQQTRVAAVLDYYARFIAAAPDVASLAALPQEELHKLWQGLGYYSRSRNLQKAAQYLVANNHGQLPADYDALRALPGIGDYTAGAIASIAFGLPVVAVDGNVLRVFSRLLNSPADITLPAVKKQIAGIVQAQQPPNAPGDFNQAVMELGALVCLPASPRCEACPLQPNCHAYSAGTAAQLPYKPPKKARQQSDMCVLVVHCNGKVLLQKRPAQGLLAGLWQPVLLEGHYTAHTAAQALQKLVPNAIIGSELPAHRHVFTHKIWQLYGWQASLSGPEPIIDGARWATPKQVQSVYSIPSAFAPYLPFLGQPT